MAGESLNNTGDFDTNFKTAAKTLGHGQENDNKGVNVQSSDIFYRFDNRDVFKTLNTRIANNHKTGRNFSVRAYNAFTGRETDNIAYTRNVATLDPLEDATLHQTDSSTNFNQEYLRTIGSIPTDESAIYGANLTPVHAKRLSQTELESLGGNLPERTLGQAQSHAKLHRKLNSMPWGASTDRKFNHTNDSDGKFATPLTISGAAKYNKCNHAKTYRKLPKPLHPSTPIETTANFLSTQRRKKFLSENKYYKTHLKPTPNPAHPNPNPTQLPFHFFMSKINSSSGRPGGYSDRAKEGLIGCKVNQGKIQKILAGTNYKDPALKIKNFAMQMQREVGEVEGGLSNEGFKDAVVLKSKFKMDQLFQKHRVNKVIGYF